MTGFTFEEALGDGWSQVIHPEDLEFVYAKWEISMQAQTAFDQVLRYRVKDGATLWVQLNIAQIKSGQEV
ncbi:MAG: PAS domain-containing protein, partial [Bacteroidetes bacterium]|nr:PAS domain-containing protein [Bacteroidota bacterium]